MNTKIFSTKRSRRFALYTTGLSLTVILALLIAGNFYSHPSVNVEGRDNVLVGNLGGMKVNIPSFYVELLEYEGDPGWSGNRNVPRPVRTHQSRMVSFGVIARYPDMAGLSSPAMRADKVKYTAANTPWIDLTILTGPIYPGDGWLDRRSQYVVNSIGTHSPDIFKKDGDNIFGGLDLYVQQGESINGKPLRENRDDIYIHQDRHGHVNAHISCSNTKLPAAPCEHSFSMEDDGLSVQVRIHYRRAMLMHWQDMQDKARRLILSWKAQEVSSPAEFPTASASSVNH